MKMQQGRAALVYDVPASPPYGGSCGIVARAIRRALRQERWSVQEQLLPLEDKVSEIILPRKGRSPQRGVHVFFEELFARCRRDPEYRKHPNLVFFNLQHFKIARHCEADGLIFCSKYLRACFLYESALRRVPPPPATWASLPLPLHDFPRGYPSTGVRLDRRALKALSQEFHLGHALRFRKSDPFATLSVMHHLNQLAHERGAKPFRLMVSEYDMPRYQDAVREVPLLQDSLVSLIPTGALENPSMISLMKHASYSLCYDRVVEAFGFYPIESVYCGCPVFTNGSGNLRYLLPPNAGIEVYETLEMYWGTIDERIRAYTPVAERVFRTVTQDHGAASCERGARYIDRHYSQPAFAQRLATFVTAVCRSRQDPSLPQVRSAGKSRPQLSPYLRMASWKTGHFVTDLGTLSVPAARSLEWQRLLCERSSARVADRGTVPIPPVIGALGLEPPRAGV